MNSKRLYLILLALIAVLLVATVGGAYEASNLLQNNATQLADTKQKSQTLAAQQAQLVNAKRDINKYADLETITKSIVPQDKDQAEAVREITNIASANGVTLTAITFPASTLGATVPTTGTGSAATTPKPATGAKAALSQLQVVPNIPGVYTLQLTINDDTDSAVTYNQLYNFLKGLENNRRTAQVSNIVIQPVPNNASKLTFSLVLNVYIKPAWVKTSTSI